MLLFGGCYSNREATCALRVQADRLGIPPERAICTGDVVAYCADAAATVALIRDWGVHVVMGNCEESLGWSRDDCGCGFAKGTNCDRLSAAWYAHASSQLGEAHREWMRGLPRRIDIRIGGRRLAVVHGAADSINRFVFPSTPWQEKHRQISLAGGDGVIGGHCGIPFAHIDRGRLWHNAGAIGMPANDGTRRVRHSVGLVTEDGVELRSAPLDYDADQAARKMRRDGASGPRQPRTVLVTVKTTAYGGGLRPVLTAAARGAARCFRPRRRNGATTKQRNCRVLWGRELPTSPPTPAHHKGRSR